MTALIILSHFALGFITSFLGTLPPGAINIEVLRLSIQHNISTVLHFIAGILIAEVIYTYAAVLFSGYLASIPNLEKSIQLLSIPVFIIIGISYFFIKVKVNSEDLTTKVDKNVFIKGVSFGFFNPLQVPFWITYCTYYLSVGWVQDNTILLTIFVFGAISGTVSMLLLISKFSTRYISQMNLKVKMVNNFLGYLFLVLAGFQLYNYLSS